MHNNNIEEYSNISLSDERLNKRYIKCIRDMSNKPSQSLPSTFEDFHQTKGLYRFLDNEQVPLDKI